MLFRCNVDDKVGLRPFFQCKALAQHLVSQGLSVTFAINRSGVALARDYLGDLANVQRMPSHNEEEELNRLHRLHREQGHRGIVIHMPGTAAGYHFHLRRIFGFSTLFTDSNKPFLYGDLIVNPDFQAGTLTYHCNPEARLLLGPKYAPVEGERRVEETGRIVQVLVDMGKTQSIEPIQLLVAALERQTRNIEATFLFEGQPHHAIQEFLADRYEVEVRKKLTPFNCSGFPFVITTPGARCLEWAATGKFFLTIATETTQLNRAYAIEQMGAAPTLGWYQSLKPDDIARIIARYLDDGDLRHHFTYKASRLVDGKGCGRIANFFPR